MNTLNGWWFLSSGGSYPPVFTVVVVTKIHVYLYYFLGIFPESSAFILTTVV